MRSVKTCMLCSVNTQTSIHRGGWGGLIHLLRSTADFLSSTVNKYVRMIGKLVLKRFIQHASFSHSHKHFFLSNTDMHSHSDESTGEQRGVWYLARGYYGMQAAADKDRTFQLVDDRLYFLSFSSVMHFTASGLQLLTVNDAENYSHVRVDLFSLCCSW